MNNQFIFVVLLAWFLAMAQALATNLLVPYYVYPDTGAWDTLFNAVKANPTLTFQVIINPETGPGNKGAGYDDNWRTAVSTLKFYSNVETYGYVHTSYGAESTDAVEANITSWDTWNTYTAQNIAMDGIFFDETADSKTAYMTTLTTFAHNTLGSSSKIIFNVGDTVTDNDYYSLANYVVVFENSAASYSTSVPTTNVPSQYASKGSILIYSASSQTSATLKTWLAGMVKANIGSVIMVDDGWNDDNSASSPADIGDVASALVAAQ